MYEKHGDELGLFGRIDSPVIKDGLIVISENSINEKVKLESYLQNTIEEFLDDKKILENIDKEIKQIT